MIAGRRTWAPYAPPGTVLDLIRAFRDRDLPPRIDKTNLSQLGVPDGLVNRTWATLIFMGLIRDDGTTMAAFQRLRYASETEYRTFLLDVLRNAYEEIFLFVDPKIASYRQLDEAFRPYSPGGQRQRMITLFVGLCQEAGLDSRVQLSDRGSQAAGHRRSRKPTQANESESVDKIAHHGESEANHRSNDLDDLRRQYAEMLLARADKTQGELPQNLLDRIERILGFSPNF